MDSSKWQYDIQGCDLKRTDGVDATASCEIGFEGNTRYTTKVPIYKPVIVKPAPPPPPTVLQNKFVIPKEYRDVNLRYANMCADMYYANGKIECIPLGSYLQVCENININNNNLLTGYCYDGTSNAIFSTYNLDNWRGEHLAFYNGRLAPQPDRRTHLAPNARYYIDSANDQPNNVFTLALGAVGGKSVTWITNMFWISNQQNSVVLQQFRVGRKLRFLNWSIETGKGTIASPYVQITSITNPRPNNVNETQITISEPLRLVPNTNYQIDFSYIFTCKIETIDRRSNINMIGNSFTFYTNANTEASEEFKVGRRIRLLQWNADTGEGEEVSSYTTITRIQPFVEDPNQTHVLISPPVMMKAGHVTTFQIFD